jgi:hydroxypyruvate reductase
MPAQPRELLIQSFHTAVAAVQAERCLPAHLPPPPRGRTLAVGAGKAAAAMAASLERHWPDDAPLSGLVITRHGHACPTRRIRVVEAGHPLPDTTGTRAAGEVLALIAELGGDDLLLGLVSGGGSSLLSLPVPGLELTDLRRVSQDLLRCGASIREINIVRKHLTTTLGGRLAAASRAPVLACILSDVVGDEPASIASGPFAPDPSTYAEAFDILRRWRIDAPAAVLAHLRDGMAGRIDETPKPGALCFSRVENRIIGGGRTALLAAAGLFQAHGVTPVVLGDAFGGEARELAGFFAALCTEVCRHDSPWRRPVALLSGGEASVTVRGEGRGGRNSEFALALALALNGQAGVHILAADTDGIDGSEDNAGVLADPGSLARAGALSLRAEAHLLHNDAYGFFAPLGDLLLTGPTLTNANDYRAILIT